MSTDHASNSAVLVTQLASLAAVLAVVVGAMVLVGWVFDIAALKSILPGWFPMKANFAVALILIGIALWLTTRQQSAIRNPQSAIFLPRLCVLLVGMIGLLTLGEYIFGWNPGFDQWLFREPAGAVGTSQPGRMAQEAALSLVLLATALWISSGLRKTRWTILASVSLGLLVAILGLVAILSHLTPGLGAYGWFGFSIMALHAAMMLVILGVAVIAISWQPDVLPWSLSRRTTAAFACGVVVLVFIGFNTSRSQFWMKETNRQIVYSEEVLADIGNLLIEVIDAQAHTRGYVITGDELFKNHYLEAQAGSNAKLDALRKLVASNPHQQQQFTQIEVRVNAELQWLQQVVAARQAGMADATRNNMVTHGEDLLDNLRSIFDQIESEHQLLVERLKQESESVARLSYFIIFTGTLVSLLIFMIVIFRLNSAANEYRQQGQALRESEEKFRKIAESANDAIITAAGTGNIMGWNAAAERLFGYTEAEINGQPLTMLMPERFRSLHREGLARVMAGGVPHVMGKTVELAGLRKDGSEFPLELSLAQWQANGQFFTAIIRDITERKKAEVKIKEQLDFLERFQKVAVKREFRIKELTDAAEKQKTGIGTEHG